MEQRMHIVDPYIRNKNQSQQVLAKLIKEIKE
jgi:hypothetical protein